MGKLFRRLQFVLMLAGLGFLGLNFSNPEVAKTTMKAVGNTMQVKPIDGKKLVQEQMDPEEAKQMERRFVQIDGKLYDYNPRGVYNVNGVPTMYKNGQPKTWAEILKDRELAAVQAKVREAADDAYGVDHSNRQALQKVDQMAKQGPLSVYSPGGMKALVDGARAAAAAANERNRALNQLDKE